MSSVSNVPSSVVPPQPQPTQSSASAKRAPDGDTAAQEAAQAKAAQQAEKQNGGSAPKSGVNIIA